MICPGLKLPDNPVGNAVIAIFSCCSSAINLEVLTAADMLFAKYKEFPFEIVIEAPSEPATEKSGWTSR